jgi:hypothetical protein
VKHIDRETILGSVERVLRYRDSRVDASWTLEQLVLMVAADLRDTPTNDCSHPRIIPAPTVAAFVENNTTAAETQAVCAAVLIDNSIIAELIAAMDTRRGLALQPLSDPLMQRLLGMVGALPNANMNSQHAIRDPIVVLGDKLSSGKPARTATEITVQPLSPEMSESRESSRYSSQWVLPAMLTLAGMLFVVVSLVISQMDSGILPEMAAEPGDTRGQSDATRDRDTSNDAEEARPEPTTERNWEQSAVSPTNSVEWPLSSEVRLADNSSDPSAGEPQENTDVAPDISAIPEQVVESVKPQVPVYRSLERFTWTSVNGMLAQEFTREETNFDDSQGYPTTSHWRAIAAESRGDVAALTDSGRWLTLPGCRAAAQFEGGGQLVLAADTAVTLKADPHLSAVVGIEHGSLALVDLPPLTAIQFEFPSGSTDKLVCQTETSLLVGFGPAGLQLQVAKGTVASQQSLFERGAFSVDKNGTFLPIEPPRQLPLWLDREGPKLNLPKHVLAQFAVAPNLLPAVDQQLKQILSDPSFSAAEVQLARVLATWETALVGPHLFRMISRSEPVLRQAAIARLLQTPEWEPRYESIWSSLELAHPDLRQVHLWKMLAAAARRAEVPTANQVDQLLQGLQANGMPVRAISDQLLRTFFVGGPVYDPTWTGQTQTRATGFWRRYVVQVSATTRTGS